MPKLFHSISLVALMMLCLFPVSVFAQDWIVSRTTKQVSYTLDKQTWVPVTGGMAVPNKSWISTGPRGRVELERGTEKVTFGPETLAAIITENGLFSRKTNVVQQQGHLSLDIEKRSRPHTYVHTPFLAAVVKGTSFQVTVTARDASVSVERGLVQVSSFTSGQSTNLGPGQQATVDQNQNMSVAGIDGAPSVEATAPSAASIAPIGQVSPIGTEALGGAGTSSNPSTGSSSGSDSSSSSSSEFGGAPIGQKNLSGGGNNGNGNGGGNGSGNNGNGNGNGGGNGSGNSGNGNGNGGGSGSGNNGNGSGNGGGIGSDKTANTGGNSGGAGTGSTGNTGGSSGGAGTGGTGNTGGSSGTGNGSTGSIGAASGETGSGNTGRKGVAR